MENHYQGNNAIYAKIVKQQEEKITPIMPVNLI